MTSAMFRAFVKEAMALQTEDQDTPPDYVSVRAAVMQKLALGNIGLASSLYGLKTLADPSIAELRDKPMSEKDKAKKEVKGLALIAGPEAYELAKGSRGPLGRIAGRLKGAVSKARA